MVPAAGSAASASWPTANKAFYTPFYFPGSFTISALCILNNSGAGNCSLALYDEDGTRLVTTGSFALPGVLQVTSQAVSLSVTRGSYYLGASMSAGGTFRFAPGIEVLRLAGCFVETSAHPLPSTATFAAIDANYLPIVGVAITAPPA